MAVLATFNLNPIIQLTDDQFYDFCRANPNVKFERNAKGAIIVVSLTGGETGQWNSELNADFVIWNRQTKLGIVFGSSTCFRLPNSAMRSPDLAWVELSRWNQLTPEQQKKFPPICPDFVLELLSPSDTLAEIQEKMQEYQDNGLRLGWLVSPQNQLVEIYRMGQSVEVLPAPPTLSGESVLPDFVLVLTWLWSRNPVG